MVSGRPYRGLSDRVLRSWAKRADDRLAYEIDRLRQRDPDFRYALDAALALEAEIETRKS